MNSAASNANAAYYADSAATDYVHEPYHALRRQVAAEFALSAVRLGRAGGEAVVLLELGAGANTLLDRDALPAQVHYLTMDLATFDDSQRHFVADVAESIPVRSGSVDVLVSCELIEHIYDTEAFLTECARVLRPAGHLVLTTPNLAALQDRLAFLRGRSPRQVSPLHPYLRFHIRPFTRRSLDAAVTASGFGEIRVRSNYVVWRSRSDRKIRARLPARILPGLGGSLILHARRSSAGGPGSRPGFE